ncbi:MAG: branched-chain-amino-acid transaminase [Candidatus Ratteibacteria bacterium]|nr:branched-chain-amino-acid transaminase [Candidatus Ratteibacteria bacterium]
MGLLIYLNGRLIPEDEAKVSVFDHGLLYGDGVFEGIRGYNGRIFKLDEHLRRLYASAKAIMLDVPLEFSELKDAIVQTVRANKLKDSYIRVVVTRGEGDLGLDPKKCRVPTLFIIASSIQLYPAEIYERGLNVVTVAVRRNLTEAVNPAIKSLNYLNNIMAKIEANSTGASEGIMLNNAGYVSEGTGENIFIVSKNSLFTPPVTAGVLDGITRDTVMDLGRGLGLEVEEKEMTRYDIFTADECFLTGTAAEIVPVVCLDGRPIGTGKPGEVTNRIRKEYTVLTMSEGVPIYE